MDSSTQTAAAQAPASADLRARIEPPCASLPPLERLCRIVHLLRAPGGCPWDREQTHKSLVPLLLEEAFETAEAIESGNVTHMCEELGDILLHVVMHAEIAGERDAFDFDTIAAGVAEKMIRRHPHVFGSVQVGDSETVLRQWDEIKKDEKAASGSTSGRTSDEQPVHPHLDGISRGLPGLIRAHKLQKRAAKVGFEFPSVRDALGKVHEELAEVEQELTAHEGSGDAASPHMQFLGAELGDLLFSVVNVTRLLEMDAETLLAAANRKFETRFAAMEQRLQRDGRDLKSADLATMEAAWQACKKDLS